MFPYLCVIDSICYSEFVCVVRDMQNALMFNDCVVVMLFNVCVFDSHTWFILCLQLVI